MAVLESREYGHRRRMLAGCERVRQMARGLAGSRADYAHDDGTPRFGFMMAANREYAARRWPGDPEPGHIGAVAEAVLMVLEEEAPSRAADRYYTLTHGGDWPEDH